MPNAPIEQLKYQHAVRNVRQLASHKDRFASWPADEQQDWMDDEVARQLHDMPADFWEQS